MRCSARTHMLPEITLWRGRQSHILLSTWVPEMGFLLSECELQAILLIHERYVTLFINSVTYRYVAVTSGRISHGCLAGAQWAALGGVGRWVVRVRHA